jgi:cobalt-zinc-cadmium efflux system outer membrane protein
MRLYLFGLVLIASVTGVCLVGGCRHAHVHMPSGHYPVSSGALDNQSTKILEANSSRVTTPALPPVQTTPADGIRKPTFEVPPALPGADVPPTKPPVFDRNTPSAQRDETIRKTYPTLESVSTSLPVTDHGPLSLGELQQMALANSPAIRRAIADADAAFGQVIQAGLYPNPNFGYQADQWQPGTKPENSSGQHGVFINQLIKTAGKLRLSQQVAGFDYINALVAGRKAHVSVIAAVRTNYFNVLIAERSLEVSKALATMADEVYRLQLKQVAAGEAAGYEPLLVYAQAEQARNAVDQAEAGYLAAWRQLAAAIGQPHLKPVPLAGRADAEAPIFNLETARAFMIDHHTDLLTARNLIAQAQTNLILQRRMPISDVQAGTIQQYDTGTRSYQFSMQLGVALPIYDRNQGNIHSAQAKIGSSLHNLAATENDLMGQLAEAFGRYESNRRVAQRFRDKVLPSQTQAYRMLVRRYQVEPDKVGFNDIVTAQQNLALSLQSYLAALTGQWQAAVDFANRSQLDELYAEPTQSASSR